MEVWVDPATGRVMAIYDPGPYTGRVWQDLGYEKYDEIEPWMKPHENPPDPIVPPEPTVIRAEDGKEYIIDSAGKLKLKIMV